MSTPAYLESGHRDAAAAARERVVLVDAQDRAIGTAGKLDAHRSGRLHRAFSVFLFDARGAVLLQRRAADKYHSAGLWTNTCCSHPRPGESVADAARRRLREEMGIDRVDGLRRVFGFVYRAELAGGLVEHEYDHVLVGRYAGTPSPNPAEVADWRWAAPPRVGRALQRRPSAFTAWFPLAFGGLARAR